jgi:hypothetical protein
MVNLGKRYKEKGESEVKGARCKGKERYKVQGASEKQGAW